MPTTADLIGLAIDKNPVDFASTFDEIIRQKQEAALEAKKIEMAQNIYGEPEDDLDDDDFDFESDDEDFDDGDVDDDDLDLDDLDLDDLDLDLEDIADDNEDA